VAVVVVAGGGAGWQQGGVVGVAGWGRACAVKGAARNNLENREETGGCIREQGGEPSNRGSMVQNACSTQRHRIMVRRARTVVA